MAVKLSCRRNLVPLVRADGPMEEIIENIGSHHDLSSNLNQLGTLLREETHRLNPILYKCIPDLITLLYSAEVQETLRVLINFTADNDANRLELLKFQDLWTRIREIVNNPRVSMFLAQFTKNTDHLNKFMVFFYKMGLHMALIKEIETDDGFIIEVLSEMLTDDIITQEFRNHVMDFLDMIIHKYQIVLQKQQQSDAKEDDEEEDTEMLENLSKIMYNLTKFQDLPTYHIQQIYPLFHASNTLINRQLFATIGDLSSMTTFEDFNEVKYAIENIHTDHSYIKASYYMVIGNYITDSVKSQQVLDHIGDNFITNYFQTKFTDVVLYQTIHLIKNITNKFNYDRILQDPNIYHTVKVVADNKTYYPEIYNQYTKFFQKLIGYLQPGDPYKYLVWDLVDDHVLQRLSETLINNQDPLNKRVLEATFLTDLPSDANQLLDKLKYQAICINRDLPSVYNSQEFNEFVKIFVVQYNKLYQMLFNETSRSGQFAVILNNSKFVSASLLKYDSPEITAIAKNIIAIE